tara:strand:- start:1 stop:243 length:243 start_codon:yes stop_codon:yes gene_type:complete
MKLSAKKYLQTRKKIDSDIWRIHAFAENLQMLGEVEHSRIYNDPIRLIGKEVETHILNVQEALNYFASTQEVEEHMNQQE